MYCKNDLDIDETKYHYKNYTITGSHKEVFVRCTICEKELLIGECINGLLRLERSKPVLVIDPKDREYIESLITPQCSVGLSGKTFRKHIDSNIWIKCTTIDEGEEEYTHEQFMDRLTSLFVRGQQIYMIPSKGDVFIQTLIKNISVFEAAKELINDTLKKPTKDWFGTIERIEKQIESLSMIQDPSMKWRGAWNRKCEKLLTRLTIIKTLLETQSRDNDIYLKLIAPYEAGKLANMSGGVVNLRHRRYSF